VRIAAISSVGPDWLSVQRSPAAGTARCSTARHAPCPPSRSNAANGSRSTIGPPSVHEDDGANDTLAPPVSRIVRHAPPATHGAPRPSASATQ